jgi:hypothetical protein
MKLLILLTTFLLQVKSHSWLECSDYRINSLSELSTFDRSKCFGYPRSFENQYNQGFAIETGYNQHSTECKYSYKESYYNDKIKMANYKSNQIIYTTHPSKNHVADICTNQYIPSTQMKLLRSSSPGSEDFSISLNLLGGDHVNGVIDYLGYQRCFEFCSNMDKSTCILGFQLDDVKVSGIYSFKWFWEFNKGEVYTSCFDAYITPSNKSPSVIPSSTPSPIPSPSPSPPVKYGCNLISYIPTETPSNRC